MKTKTFDCVDMKRKGAERVLDELQGLTTEQQLEYWRRFTDALVDRQRRRAVSTPGHGERGPKRSSAD